MMLYHDEKKEKRLASFCKLATSKKKKKIKKATKQI